MAVYPTDKSSPGTWGAECSAYHAVSTDLATGKIKDGAVQVSAAAPTVDAALANKKYVDDGSKKPINGTPTEIFTKYLTGQTDADTSTDVPHGISNGKTKIYSVTVHVISDSGNYAISEFKEASSATSTFVTVYDDDDIRFIGVGTDYQGHSYKIKIDYIA